MAKAHITYKAVRPVSNYDGIKEITLQITPEEAQAIHAVAVHVRGDTVGGKAFYGLRTALLNAGLDQEGQALLQDIRYGAISFSR